MFDAIDFKWNEEEKEAIEYFTKRIDICMENADICDDNNFDEEATCLRKEQYSTEIILNLIQKQQKEIEKKDKIIDELAARVYLTKEEREYMKKDIHNSFEGIPFSRWVKQYFEKKVESEDK